MSGVLSNDAYKNTFGNPGSNAQGAIVAAMPAGSFAGALAVTWLADHLGRKWTVILSGWIWVIGCILQCASQVRLHCARTSPACLRASIVVQGRNVLFANSSWNL